MTTRTLPGYNGRPTWDAAHGGVVAPIVPGTSVWVGTLFLPNTAPETRIIKAYCSLAGGIVAAGGSAYSLHIHALSADGAAGGTALVAVPRFAGFVLNLGVGGTLRGGPPAPTEIDPPLAARTVQPAQGGELIWTQAREAIRVADAAFDAALAHRGRVPVRRWRACYSWLPADARQDTVGSRDGAQRAPGRGPGDRGGQHAGALTASNSSPPWTLLAGTEKGGRVRPGGFAGPRYSMCQRQPSHPRMALGRAHLRGVVPRGGTSAVIESHLSH